MEVTPNGSNAPSERVLWVTALVMIIISAIAGYAYIHMPKPLRFTDVCPGNDSTAAAFVRAAYLGLWQGKWDEKWEMSFQVQDDPKRNGFLVTYKWEEQPGQPMNQTEFLACLNGNSLDNGSHMKMTVNAGNPNAAKLVGDFPKHTRISDLVRKNH